MLVRFLFGWLSNVVALFVAAALIPGIGYGDSWWTLLLAGLVFALVNIFVRPLVILFTLPFVLLTLGIALFFINLFMLWLTGVIVDDFETGGFWSLVGGTLIVWLVNLVLEGLGRRWERWR
jgi:putative membrane protein